MTASNKAVKGIFCRQKKYKLKIAESVILARQALLNEFQTIV
jgi:hypothetical protein